MTVQTRQLHLLTVSVPPEQRRIPHGTPSPTTVPSDSHVALVAGQSPPAHRCPECGTPALAIGPVVDTRPAWDEVAGLPFRASWDREAADLLAQARYSRTPVALMMLDLDCFKSVNDLYGHHAGDVVVGAVASLLRTVVSGDSILCRYGAIAGDEFLILMPNTDGIRLGAMAARIQAGLRALAVTAEQARDQHVIITGLTASIGAVVAPAGCLGGDVHGLLLDVDVALRRAKRAGGDQLCVTVRSDTEP
jgi:diguanylate cyclase (GGDEF)-like protein